MIWNSIINKNITSCTLISNVNRIDALQSYQIDMYYIFFENVNEHIERL